MNFAQPESTAESITRIGGAVAAGIGVLTLWGLYSSTNPSNWLSNIGMSVGDNSFRTLSMFGAGLIIVGGALFLRKGLYLVVAGMIATLAIVGHGKWYSVGNNVNAPRQIAQASFVSQSEPQKPEHVRFVNASIKLTTQQIQWCDQDKNGDGKPNRYDSVLAKQNCETGFIHKGQ